VRKRGGSFADERKSNLAVKCDLVDRGLAHGILVYDGKEPIGWCQFGPQRELPLRDVGTRKRNLLPHDPEDNVWRITCFCTLKEHRTRGVAELALVAALQAIRRSGGGIVRAYPVVTLPNDKELDALIRGHGADSPKVRAHAKKRFGASEVVAYDGRAFSVGGVFIDEQGPLWALVRWVPAATHTGTVSMFAKQGFKAIGLIKPTSRKLPSSRLVMQRTIRNTR
jgi:hypothetical protein